MFNKTVVILGAGISGLSLAWQLKQQRGAAVNVTLVDRADRVGGWIQSDCKDGFLIEQGARAVRTHGSGAVMLRLVRQLGLEREVIAAAPQSRRRFLYVDGHLRVIPHNLLSVITSSLTWNLLGRTFRNRHHIPDSQSNESIDAFVRGRWGHAMADVIADSMVSGIFAGDSRELSFAACFPKLYNLIQDHSSLLKIALARRTCVESDPYIRRMQQEPLISFRGGMHTLIQALADRIDADMLLGQQIVALCPGEVHTTKRCIPCDHVISTLPAHALAPMLHALCPEGADLLQSIHYASLSVVNVGFRNLRLPQQGFGYLIPRCEGEKVLGCVWNSSVFPQHYPKDATCLSIMMRGNQEQDSIPIAMDAIQRHLGIAAMPDVVQVSHPKLAIPQYEIGHLAKIYRLQALVARDIPWLTLAGTLFGGVGVNDCIAASETLVKRPLFAQKG